TPSLSSASTSCCSPSSFVTRSQLSPSPESVTITPLRPISGHSFLLWPPALRGPPCPPSSAVWRAFPGRPVFRDGAALPGRECGAECARPVPGRAAAASWAVGRSTPPLLLRFLDLDQLVQVVPALAQVFHLGPLVTGA